MLKNMSPEFGRLKEPEEPGKGGCKLLNTWEGYQGKDTHARTEIRADTRHISYTDPTQAEEDKERDAHESRQLPGKGNGGKKTNGGCAWCIFFYSWECRLSQMKWKSTWHKGTGSTYMRLGRLSSQSFHIITYFQSNFGKEVSHGKWQKKGQ